MTVDYANQLLPALRRSLGPRWRFEQDGERLHVRYDRVTNAFMPPRRVPDPAAMLHVMETTCAELGISRAPVLPLRWGRDTELTVSAVQALDPYLKDGQPFTFRQGFLPQPVIRFTGKRDEHGRLLDGFLTSFVNVSCVQPIHTVQEHAQLIDAWLTVLSRLGFHASHLEFSGSLRIWTRREVQGITLHLHHAGFGVGDAVLLWNRERPEFLATDLGSGLERLRWALARCKWGSLTFGPPAQWYGNETLDGIRTATLLIGSGILPSARGAGSAVRRVVGIIQPPVSLGVAVPVRDAHMYWNAILPLEASWPHVCTLIERECARTPVQDQPRIRQTCPTWPTSAATTRRTG